MVLLQGFYKLTISALSYVTCDSSSPLSQYKDMDQGGLKRNGNRDGSLTFEETGGRLGGDTGDPDGSLLQPDMHLPGIGSLPSSAVSSTGQGGSKDSLELGSFFLSDMKEGKGRMQKQHNIDQFSMESNLLKQTIPDATSIITTSDTSVLGNLPLPDLFPQHIKQQETFSLDKDLDTYSTNTAVGQNVLESNSDLLLEDSAIWKDLELSCSLPEISDFELDTEVAHLDNILHQCKSSRAPMSTFPKDIRSALDRGNNCPSLNGTDHSVQKLSHQQQPGPLLSSVTIKEEKDPDPSFIHIRTPEVVKQEKGDGDAFCDAACLQSAVSSKYEGCTMASLPVGLGLGPDYNYTANLASVVDLQDQKPFSLYPNLPVSRERWGTGSRYGESAGIQREDDGVQSITVLGSFPSSFSR